jgi:hypothetical protein
MNLGQDCGSSIPPSSFPAFFCSLDKVCLPELTGDDMLNLLGGAFCSLLTVWRTLCYDCFRGEAGFAKDFRLNP